LTVRHCARLAALALAAALSATGLQAVAAPALPGFAAALERAGPLFFGVYGLESDPLPQEPDRPRDLGGIARVGSGFFIDGRGLAVTAAHVVEQARRVAVKMPDGRIHVAEVLGSDDVSDIALIRMPVAPPAAPAFGRAAALRPADWVLALGERYGLGHSVSAGVVGGTRRHFAQEPIMTYIQSDAALNPGNSGGPLVDAEGAIVGMNVRTVVAVAGSPGVSLSIPIEVVLDVARGLQAGAIQRPRLGAEFHDLTPGEALALGRAYAHGALVDLVAVNSLAEAAGLRSGDVIVGFDGRLVASSADLALALLQWRRAAGTRLAVFRDGQYLRLKVQDTLPRPSADTAGSPTVSERFQASSHR
jgi:serine protease Do